jgi:hypothetical protein
MNVSAGATFDTDSGGVLVFDGINDWARVDSLSDFFRYRNGSFTFQTWVKPSYDIPSDSGGRGGVLLSMHNATSNMLRWQITKDKISVLDLPDNNIVYNHNKNLAWGVWYLYTLVGDHVNNQITLYIDTSEITTGSMTCLDYWDDIDRVSIGQEYDGYDYTSEHYAGSIGLWLAYDRAMTASEVASNYEASKLRFGYSD